MTETEPLGGRLGGPLVSFQQVSTRALRAQDRALRARVPKKIKTLFLRLFLKTFFKDFFVGESRWTGRQGLAEVPKGGALRAQLF